jgi:hypothetical protein
MSPKTKKLFHNLKKHHVNNMGIVFVVIFRRSEICERMPHCQVENEFTLSECYNKDISIILVFLNTVIGFSCETCIFASRIPGVSWTTI